MVAESLNVCVLRFTVTPPSLQRGASMLESTSSVRTRNPYSYHVDYGFNESRYKFAFK